jgi:hypothetical protein
MRLLKAALPAGIILFLLGIVYAGLPSKLYYEWGIDFTLAPETQVLLGVISFSLGSLLMWKGKEEWGEEYFFDGIRSETLEIRRILAERKSRAAHADDPEINLEEEPKPV